ncbi:uncharacterized protein Cpr78Cb isoform X1 [Drosophila suzukii]|uniref:Uncharacterized protein Cpr78Cb isoform X1 n=1 Tax=Drosophila suzukii TaxID=28584 RepID=A0ABM4TQL5_DROSZ
MPLKFNEAIELLFEDLSKNPTPEQQLYVDDADEISEKINQEFANINSIFKGTITNLNKIYFLTDIPIPKMNWLLFLKMPFKVEPQEVHIPGRDDSNVFNLKTSVHHPAVRNGHVIGEVLVNLFRLDLYRVIERISKVTCKSGKSYKLCYNMATDKEDIDTIEVYDAKHDEIRIWYGFVPVFSFSDDSVRYVVYNNFFLREKDSERAKKELTKCKIVHFLWLQLKICKYLPSSINIGQILGPTSLSPGGNAGDILLEVLGMTITIANNPGPLICVYEKLLQFKQSDSVEMPELKELFAFL